MPRLRRTLYDRAHVKYRNREMQRLRRQHAEADMTARETLYDAVAPSILAADFARLGEAVDEILAAGARVIHVDIMDGHFVPPLTFGPGVCSALKERVHAAGGILDVHLMIEAPERQVAAFADAGADVITIHAEATPHIDYTLSHIRERGVLAGLAVCPSTPLGVFAELSGQLDMALCMTVNPGWGGQKFIERSLERIQRLRALLDDGVALQVDGGVDVNTAGPCARAGATTFVAGSAVFGAADPAAAYAAIADAARAGAALPRV
jgi:ribulose-phosphate 3-epimerase